MSLFCELGEALYGPQWRGPLARALAISDREVRRWANGQNEPPAWALRELTERLAMAERDRAGLVERARATLGLS